KYPKFVEVMKNRHTSYNNTINEILKLEKEGKIFVIRPEKPVEIGRLEKDAKKMEALYKIGLKDAKKNFVALCEYLNK
ncbi:MAG: patatin family protein, partial [Lachnospiraceae bacterium]|nr:patatin family protein [Lachnospiraceae bacterium]